MPDEIPRYNIRGDVGLAAVVMQGEYLTNITIQPKTVEDVKKILDYLEKKRGKLERPGLPRQLKPEVFINRYTELKRIQDFFDDKDAKILYVAGIAGVGKSTLVRGVLENRNPEIPLIWINCKGADMDRLLLQMNNGFKLEVQDILRTKGSIETKIEAVLCAVTNKSIMVLDEFEELLNEKEGFRTDRIESFVKDLSSLEHKIKVVAATRRLPHDTNEVDPSIEVLRLKGLSKKDSLDYFKGNAKKIKLSSDETNLATKSKAFQKINGHPYFLELFALALRDLPLDELEKELLDAADIDQYLTKNVLDGLNDDELGLLQISKIFRSEFQFDVLRSVYEKVKKKSIRSKLLKDLIRESLIERIIETDSYYIHPLLRDVIPFDSENEALAHNLAAHWFLKELDSDIKLEFWDDGVYHLQRATVLGKNEVYYGIYKEFLLSQEDFFWKNLWVLRLTHEYEVLLSLINDCVVDEMQRILDSFVITSRLSSVYLTLNETEKALAIHRNLIDLFPLDPKFEISDEEKKIWIKIEARARIKTGLILTRMSAKNPQFIEEAQQIVKFTEKMVKSSEDAHLSEIYRELQFEIARKTNNPEMLKLANEMFDLAKEEYDKEKSPSNANKLAEAHFNLAVSNLRLGNIEATIEHFAKQLSLRIEAGGIIGFHRALMNNGLVLWSFGVKTEGCAMFICSDQIAHEVGIKIDDVIHKDMLDMIEKTTINPSNIEKSRKYLMEISDQLIPYYDRGIKRLVASK